MATWARGVEEKEKENVGGGEGGGDAAASTPAAVHLEGELGGRRRRLGGFDIWPSTGAATGIDGRI
uniref:Uncharacterized protein n=1 Tax=Aegilops tauschii TaxID=37682 RepID=M8CFH6_AEGTA